MPASLKADVVMVPVTVEPRGLLRDLSVSQVAHRVSLFTPPVWPAHQESQKEGQGGHFQVYDSVPGSQPEDAGAVQPCKYKYSRFNYLNNSRTLNIMQHHKMYE